MAIDDQHPLGSGFGAATTAEEVVAGVDLTGRTAIVTGGASGIGVETARVLAAAGATVIVPARDPARAADALAGVPVELTAMDLTDPASVDAFADRFLAEGRPLDMLVASAGVGGLDLQRDGRGYELHLATNHLGHAQLAARLWPALGLAGGAAGARVVVLSSWAHRASPIVWDDPMYERRPYDARTAYGQSKTANNLFAVALDRRGAPLGVRAFAVHPGGILDTRFGRNVPDGVLEAFGMVDADGHAIIDPAKGRKSVPQGAATGVWCATSRQLDGLGGLYAQDCDLAPLLDEITPEDEVFASLPRGVARYSVDPDAAERLWALTAELLGRALPEPG